jgi:hypothetical protein
MAAAPDAPDDDEEREPSRRRWIVAAVLGVALAVALGVATVVIVNGSSTSEVELLPGKTIEVPNDLADLDRRAALVAVLDGVADAAGYTDAFRDCVADRIGMLSDAELSTGAGAASARTDQLLAAAGGCEGDGEAIAADATPEQIDFLRELTAVQIAALVRALPDNAALVDCVPDAIRTMGDERVRGLFDGPGGLSGSVRALERRCRAKAASSSPA